MRLVLADDEAMWKAFESAPSDMVDLGPSAHAAKPSKP